MVGLEGQRDPIKLRVQPNEPDAVVEEVEAFGSGSVYVRVALPHPLETVTLAVTDPSQVNLLAFSADR